MALACVSLHGRYCLTHAIARGTHGDMGKKTGTLEGMAVLLGVGALAARLGVSESTLWRYRQGMKMGRAVKMLWENLIAERKKK